MQRSIEMAINVFTDADTETPCMYDTVLHINVPNVHSNHNKANQKVNKSYQYGSYNSINITNDFFPSTPKFIQGYSLILNIYKTEFYPSRDKDFGTLNSYKMPIPTSIRRQ